MAGKNSQVTVTNTTTVKAVDEALFDALIADEGEPPKQRAILETGRHLVTEREAERASYARRLQEYRASQQLSNAAQAFAGKMAAFPTLKVHTDAITDALKAAAEAGKPSSPDANPALIDLVRRASGLLAAADDLDMTSAMVEGLTAFVELAKPPLAADMPSKRGANVDRSDPTKWSGTIITYACSEHLAWVSKSNYGDRNNVGSQVRAHLMTEHPGTYNQDERDTALKAIWESGSTREEVGPVVIVNTGEPSPKA